MGAGDSGDIAWLGTYEAFFEAGRRSGIQDGHEKALTKAAAVILKPLLARRDEIWPAAVRAAAAHAQAPRTVIHSDPHLGNWYITGEGRMGLSDWARVCRGLWARDVAYALMATLEIEDRRAWEMELIEHYLAKLQSDFGVEIGWGRGAPAPTGNRHSPRFLCGHQRFVRRRCCPTCNPSTCR